ncbi:putative cytokinetic ring protein SteA [Paenibacillus filicis]|uniref:Cytokinetic ring protein SteA n=1 Tax=Paenibacillus gyeongsangnamensis TaxID=3388067 RepID=A0ABT4Q7K1_9BACL|nr:putative cytokinetic ring protein SteA [Paenibacillus filicis]MCZ8512843.1 putative cytokinetic ring protein SteA [Paenibacillus filicis]
MKPLSGSAKLPIRGRIAADRITKNLVLRLKPGAIALISHDDMDTLAAESLLEARVRAVINAGRTITGSLPIKSALRLLEAGVPVFEIAPSDYDQAAASSRAVIHKNGISLDHGWVPCTAFTQELWLERFTLASMGEKQQLRRFIENTLHYAQYEQAVILEPLQCPPLRTCLVGKQVLIVVRGAGYKQDLVALTSYIRSRRPVLIGVDGGADALLECGFRPHLIVGDMDSVTDAALRCGAELLVHGYLDGRAPGLERVKAAGLEAATVLSGGTSEDLALLLAYDQQCELMVTVGLHSHMLDFMEKGRPGMGSSWLVRMKVGGKLVDAKGISKLYAQAAELKSIPVRAGWKAYVKSLFI